MPVKYTGREWKGPGRVTSGAAAGSGGGRGAAEKGEVRHRPWQARAPVLVAMDRFCPAEAGPGPDRDSGIRSYTGPGPGRVARKRCTFPDLCPSKKTQTFGTTGNNVLYEERIWGVAAGTQAQRHGRRPKPSRTCSSDPLTRAEGEWGKAP